ncbi:uncharacterized protein [Palaemon carinicauda]|uniref:uncharacterized protein n=1 Tax=Palaemon carinicauda TaxID=392227 RepID=UPI0035B64643
MPSDWLKRWPHMADVELQSMPTDHEQVELVIGLDTTLNRVILEERHGTDNEPSAYLTKLGWVAFGPNGDRLEDSLEDKRFLATLNNTIQHQHGKNVAKLPFKESTPLPDNMNMAIRRAQSLKRRLDNDEAYKTSYVAQMEKYTDKGYAKRVPVKVPEEDRDYLRYLWWPEGVTSKKLQVFRIKSHVFGPRSSPSVVNFCLRKTALDFGSKYNEEASNSIRRNFYVDNLLKAMDDEEECIKLTRDLINLYGDGGFRLNQWTSSCKRILAAIPGEERDDSVAVLDLNKESS